MLELAVAVVIAAQTTVSWYTPYEPAGHWASTIRVEAWHLARYDVPSWQLLLEAPADQYCRLSTISVPGDPQQYRGGPCVVAGLPVEGIYRGQTCNTLGCSAWRRQAYTLCRRSSVSPRSVPWVCDVEPAATIALPEGAEHGMTLDQVLDELDQLTASAHEPVAACP